MSTKASHIKMLSTTTEASRGIEYSILSTISPANINSIKTKEGLEKLNYDVTVYINSLSQNVDEFLYGKIIDGFLILLDESPPIANDPLINIIEKIMLIKSPTFPILHELLVSVSEYLKKSSNNCTLVFLSSILRNIMLSDALYCAIIDACKNDDRDVLVKSQFNDNWCEFLQNLVSLPSRLANKLKNQIPDIFTPIKYSQALSYHIIRSIIRLNDEYPITQNVSFISSLISKVILTLGSEKFHDLIEIMSIWAVTNQNDSNVCVENILKNLQRPAIQPVAVCLLNFTRNPRNISKIFDNLLNSTSEWSHILLIKIPLLSYYNSEILIINLITILSLTKNSEKRLVELLIKMLDIWGDRSALAHTSFEQHEYITKLILFTVKILKTKLTSSTKDTVQRLLFSGTTAHLESLQIEIRAIGMITGELIVEFLREDNAPKLKYEYDTMPESVRNIVENMKKFVDKTEENFTDFPVDFAEKINELGVKSTILTNTLDNTENISINQQKMITQTSKDDIDENNHESTTKSTDSDDLDSDDDLVPYDMSNDTKISDKKRPIYLRDLKENLLNPNSNDPDLFSESLLAAEELILSQLPNDDPSLGVELLEIIMSLQETISVDNFHLLKFNACVAIVTICPEMCAEKLCREFHAKIGTYSVNDRLFFLDTLCESAKKLSKITFSIDEITKPDEKSLSLSKLKLKKPISLFIDASGGKKYETLYDEDFEVSPNDADSSENSNWQSIIEQRIKMKTRHFAHESKRPKVTKNKFNNVVKYFFYPLLYGISEKGTCMYKIPKHFVDQENILLVHFLKTLSVIVIAAENCTIIEKMALDILELAWNIRYHEQAKVRLCVIENIASVIVALGEGNFTSEIVELLLEFRTWLFEVSQDSYRGDPDKNCRSLGRHVVALIDTVIKSAVNYGKK